jgi:hypothetical protein
MPRTCTICAHPQREAIEEALLAKKPYRHIASQFDTSTAALQRHKPHLRGDLVKVYDAVEVARSERLLDSVRSGEGRAERMYAAAEDIMTKALGARDLRTALQAIRAAVDVMGEARQYMELRGELSGELGKNKPPEWPVAQIVVTPRIVEPPLLPPGEDSRT